MEKIFPYALWNNHSFLTSLNKQKINYKDFENIFNQIKGNPQDFFHHLVDLKTDHVIESSEKSVNY